MLPGSGAYSLFLHTVSASRVSRDLIACINEQDFKSSRVLARSAPPVKGGKCVCVGLSVLVSWGIFLKIHNIPVKIQAYTDRLTIIFGFHHRI